jgi:hypothetical protein
MAIPLAAIDVRFRVSRRQAEATPGSIARLVWRSDTANIEADTANVTQYLLFVSYVFRMACH